MARFGLFSGANVGPDREFEGDYMTQNGEYVMIFKSRNNPAVADEQVAAIRLDKSQAVSKIE